MNDIEKIIAEIAAQLMVAHIKAGNTTYANQCLDLAKGIVYGSTLE